MSCICSIGSHSLLYLMMVIATTHYSRRILLPHLINILLHNRAEVFEVILDLFFVGSCGHAFFVVLAETKVVKDLETRGFCLLSLLLNHI